MPKLELELNSRHSTHPSSPTRAQDPLELPPSFLALHKKVHVCMCVCVQSVLWLRAPMDEWVRLTVCESDDPSLNPAQCSSFVFLFLFFFVSLLAWADICTAELATWGVGPNVKCNEKKNLTIRNYYTIAITTGSTY